MSVYVYGLTYADVVYEIPGVDLSSVGANTRPISIGSLNQWIEDGASQMNTLLARSGVTADANLDATVHARIAMGVRAYATHKSLAVIGAVGPVYDQCKSTWDSVYTEMSNRPSGVTGGAGKTYVNTTPTDYGTNPWSFLGFDKKW